MQGMKGISHWLGITLLCALPLGCVTDTSNDPPAAPGQSNSQLATVNTQLGLAYLRNGQVDLAWERLNTALHADPDYATAHNGMALVYNRLNEPVKAEEHFKRAIALNPSDSAAQTNYGAFLCEHGRIDEGETYFMKAVENPLYANPAMAYSNAGLCKLRSADPSGAQFYFRAALRADPRFPVALMNMAQISFDDQAFMAARGYMQRYAEVRDHTPRSLWLGIRIEEMLGDKDAVSSFAMLLKGNYPDSPETQMLLKSGMQ
jgi:type IV pilus assembly protein PilF